MQILVSQAADELLNIQGIKASLLPAAKTALLLWRPLQARSMFRLLWKMGGGGHLATAGTQLKQPLEETVEELKELLRVIDKNGGL